MAKKAAVAGNTRLAELMETTKKLNKRYGSEVIKTGDKIPPIYKVPFDEPVLDYVSDGGIPIGRFTEFVGAEHSGKTRNALVAMGKNQKYCYGCHTANVLEVDWVIENNFPKVDHIECSNCESPRTGISVFVDIEGTTDPKFMGLFGIDVNGVLYMRIDKPSDAIDFVEAYLRSPEVSMIVIDSVGAMGSDKEVDNAMADDKMNQNAMFLNKGIRKWQMALNSNTNSDANSPTTMIVINQSYSSIGHFTFEIPQGGRGLRHGKGMSIKTRISERKMNKNGIDIEGVHVKVSNEKNKTGIPYRKGEYYLNLDENNPRIAYCMPDLMLQYFDEAVKQGVIERSGAWYSFEGNKYQGQEGFMAAMEDDEDLFNEIKEKLNK